MYERYEPAPCHIDVFTPHVIDEDSAEVSRNAGYWGLFLTEESKRFAKGEAKRVAANATSNATYLTRRSTLCRGLENKREGGGQMRSHHACS